MNKNFKKVATVILATNVLASTVLTTLPIGSHAAESQTGTENNLTSPVVDTITSNSTHITGKVSPNASSIKVEVHNRDQSISANYEYTTIDADGSFNISTANMNLQSGMSVFIKQVVDGVESPVTKTPVRLPKLDISPLTISSKTIQVNNAIYGQRIDCRPFKKDGTQINAGFGKMSTTNGKFEINLDLSIYSPGDYFILYQGYGSSLAEYSDFSERIKVIIYDDSTNRSQALADALFLDNDVTKGLKANTTQADIDAVQVALDYVVDTADKSAVQAIIDKATTELADKQADIVAIEAATSSVNQLFIDNTPSKGVKTDLTQAEINAAQAKINGVKDTSKKAELQAELNKAQEAFNIIAPTTISALTTDSVKVTGKGEPNAPVTIKNGTTTIGTGTVKADGTFEVTIAKQAANATITASVTKASNGKIATASTVVTQGIDYSLSANAYKMGDAKLTGKVGKNVAKVRLWINGAVAVQGVINADGTYEFPTAANFIKLIGDKVEVVAVDSKFAEVNRTTVAVSGTSTFDNALTVAKFNTGDTKITGTIGKDISKVRLWVNDKVVAQAPTTTDGTYTFANADKFITSPLDKVEVVGVDAQYKEMNRKTVSLPGSDTYNNTFSVDNYFIGQNTLGGSYGQNTSKVRLWVNGVAVKQADLNPADSTYTLKGIFGLIKSKTDVAEIVYVDAQYKEIKRVAVTIK